MATNTASGTPTPPDPPPSVRRLPLPSSQPPYDDEVADTTKPPSGHRSRRSVPPTNGALALSTAEQPQRPRPAPSESITALPDPRRWAAKLTQAAIEGLYGQRSLHQLTRWTDEAVHTALVRRARAVQQRSAVRPRIRAVRVCRVSDVVAEAAAIVQLGLQTRAVAVRLEAVDGRWLCTAFDSIE